MISVVIPHYPFSDEINKTLGNTISTLRGYDELIVYSNHGIGFAKAVNKAVELAHGEYIIVMNNDMELNAGTLAELATPGQVTSPLINGKSQPFWGACFCMPRDIYENLLVDGKLLNERFEVGYYEDEDLLKRIQALGIPHSCCPWVNLNHVGESTMKHMKKTTDNEKIFKELWG